MEFKRRVVKVPWPCIVCDKECRGTSTKRKNVRSIECAICSGWVHEICASLTPTMFDFFSRSTSLFVCGRCISISDVQPNKYSCNIGIKRLHNSPTSEAVENERQLMKLYGVNESKLDVNFDVTTVGIIDDNAVAVLRKFQPVMLERYVPLRAYGDGNCCFRAVALGMFGTESLHDYVRLLTAMEVIEHRDDYDLSSSTYSGSFKDDRIQTPSYQELVSEVTTLGQPVHMILLYGMYL